jgi:hypothetical protein
MSEVRKVYIVKYLTKEGEEGSERFAERGDAVAFQLQCMASGMKATVSKL